MIVFFSPYSPGDDKFYLAAEHLMWPGHSIIYRYTWQNGTWSAPLDLLMNPDKWAFPLYVGAASNLAQVTYVYNYDYGLQMRTESNGVLGDSAIPGRLSGSPQLHWRAAGFLYRSGRESAHVRRGNQERNGRLLLRATLIGRQI